MEPSESLPSDKLRIIPEFVLFLAASLIVKRLRAAQKLAAYIEAAVFVYAGGPFY